MLCAMLGQCSGSDKLACLSQGTLRRRRTYRRSPRSPCTPTPSVPKSPSGSGSNPDVRLNKFAKVSRRGGQYFINPVVFRGCSPVTPPPTRPTPVELPAIPEFPPSSKSPTTSFNINKCLSKNSSPSNTPAEPLRVLMFSLAVIKD